MGQPASLGAGLFTIAALAFQGRGLFLPGSLAICKHLILLVNLKLAERGGFEPPVRQVFKNVLAKARKLAQKHK
jgi:hypothetical protein